MYSTHINSTTPQIGENSFSQIIQVEGAYKVCMPLRRPEYRSFAVSAGRQTQLVVFVRMAVHVTELASLVCGGFGLLAGVRRCATCYGVDTGLYCVPPFYPRLGLHHSSGSGPDGVYSS